MQNIRLFIVAATTYAIKPDSYKVEFYGISYTCSSSLALPYNIGQNWVFLSPTSISQENDWAWTWSSHSCFFSFQHHSHTVP